MMPSLRAAPVVLWPEPRTVTGIDFLWSFLEMAKFKIFLMSSTDSGKTTSTGGIVSEDASLEYFLRIFGESKALPVINLFKCFTAMPILLMIIP